MLKGLLIVALFEVFFSKEKRLGPRRLAADQNEGKTHRQDLKDAAWRRAERVLHPVFIGQH